nr:carotenogenesis protein [Helicobacter suis]
MALSKNASSCSQISGKKILGLLPPSSRVQGIIFSVANCMICLPTAVDPVKATLAILGLVARCLPICPPLPLTILTTPAGNKSPIISKSTKILAGVGEAGLITTALPAAKAGASFQAAIKIGKFQGMIWPTTPKGS